MPSVKLTRPSPMTTAAIADPRTRAPLVLKPGDNEVTEAQLRDLHADPVIAGWREEGWIAYTDPTPEGETLKGDSKPDPKKTAPKV